VRKTLRKRLLRRLHYQPFVWPCENQAKIRPLKETTLTNNNKRKTKTKTGEGILKGGISLWNKMWHDLRKVYRK